ncbi:hypothetical protein [Synechococcus sp. PCC 6312]|uniref:hypothetical protein n=1 Tax=Synechococcus sp. (strain ATCC 27167 / PCC 6312) TaxID=195253 RepID=UPI0002E0C67B|nr:hypothetical protein [Synechococcus sp. PCC 6312]
MNPYASFAATAVDVAGIEHIVWENNGQLIHAIYDKNSGTWDQASPISNALGGSNLKLIAGDLYPYLEGGNIEYAPGLVAFWEQGLGNSKEVYAAVGRYNATGKLEWSDAVQLTHDGVADQNIDAALLQDGLLDVVYQKSLVIDPRDPQYTINPAQMGLDAAQSNRDDTDLYHTYLSVNLNQGQPSLQIFNGQSVNLTFNENPGNTATYYPLGPGAQGITPGGSPSQPSQPIVENSFPAGVTRGFNLNFGAPNKNVDGRIGVPWMSDTSNLGLQLTGNLGMTGNHQALKAKLALDISDYTKSDGIKAAASGVSPSSSVRSGSLFSIGGWGVNAVQIDSGGQVNYSPSTGTLVGLQRSFELGLQLFKQYKLNLGTKTFSIGQFRAEADFDFGLEVGYTFTQPNAGTKAPFILNQPGWLTGIGEFGTAVSFLYPAANDKNEGTAGAAGSIVQTLVGLGTSAPIIISAWDITMPPWPWPTESDYGKFGFGFGLPLTVKLSGT